MKIKAMELFQVKPRWLFLKLTTESGLEGWGEPIVEGRADTVEACVREMAPYVIGRRAGDIEDIFQTLYRGGFYRGGAVLTSAISGIEQALWDIKGKFYNVPAYELLGGAVRERVRVYMGAGGDTPEAFLKSVEARVAQGYSVVKTSPAEIWDWIDDYKKVDALTANIAAAREKYGNDIEIAIDFHGRIHRGMARVLMHELEPYKLMFVEEPVLTEHEEVFVELRRACATPIATGERNYTRWGYKNMLSAGGVDIIQPDLSHAGGLWETRKIAAMAEAYDVAVAPHCPLGPIALAACLQLDYCTPNAFIQEQSVGVHEKKMPYLLGENPFGYEKGYVYRQELPGLGIQVDEAAVREAAKEGHGWKNPVNRNGDGAFVEW